jgi:hypothetical protein
MARDYIPLCAEILNGDAKSLGLTVEQLLVIRLEIVSHQ